MQILSMAKLARNGLNGDIEEAAVHAGHILDAIAQIAAAAIAELDAKQIKMEEARLRDSEGRDGSTLASSPFASLQPL
jgi:hypothetical protein